jgi:hypothetical protein
MEGEVVLPYTVRRSNAAMAIPLGWSQTFRFEAIGEYFPWRGFAVALMLFVGWSLVLRYVEWPWLEWAWIGVLLLGLAACSSELVFRRDRLITDGIERRSGLFGRSRLLVPYRMVERVTVEHPGRGSRWDVGTVEVLLSGKAIRLVGIAAPNEVASIIEHCRKESQDG